MSAENTIIIGGGISGLTAAYELCKEGKLVTVLEARNRLGGRIHTLHDEAFQLPVEAGAEFVHGNLPETIKLLKEADIPYYPMEGRMFQFKNGELHKQEGFSENDELLVKRLKELEHDMTVDEFLNTYFNNEKYSSMKNSIRGFVEGYDAADIKRASVIAFRNEWLKENPDESGWEQYRIKGGYQRLIDYLSKEAESKGCKIILNTIVKEIKWSGQAVEVITNDKTYSATKAIITVPLGVLQADSPSNGAILFNPAIPEKMEAIGLMGYGGVIKILLKFKEAFWKDKALEKRLGVSLESLSFLFSDATIPTWWTQFPEPFPILTGWLGGPKAERFSLMDEETILQEGLKSLAHIFRINEKELKEKLTEWHIINWMKDPFAKGAYTYATVETKRAVEELSRSVENTLFFAGEAIYEGPEVGTVEAAIASGKIAAEKLVRSS